MISSLFGVVLMAVTQVALTDVPVSSQRVREALGAALERNDAGAVADLTRQLADMGASLSPAGRERVGPLLAPDRRAALVTTFDANVAPIGQSTRIGAIPNTHRLIEGIAIDPLRRRLFAGSILDRRLLTGIGSKWREVPIDNLGGVFGMTIDTHRRLLWIASSPADPMAETASAFAGLVAVNLDTLREVRRVPMPDTRPGDSLVASDGTVYVSDSNSGAVYRCRPGCSTAEVLVPTGRLRSPQGLVLRDRERVLVLADYSLGLFRVDLASGDVTPIAPTGPTMLEGIDGLVGRGDDLIAIQNGTGPRRIIAIRLDPGSRNIMSVEPLERANPGWGGEPTLGALDGDRLIYVADSQWDRFAPGGSMRGEAPLRPTSIRMLPLR